MPSKSLDSLYSMVAKKVLTETLSVKSGEALTVEAWNNGLDFARRVVAEARSMGCTAIMLFEDEAAYVEGVKKAPKDSIGVMGKNEYNLLAGSDAYVFIPGQALGSYSRTLSAVELAVSTRYNDSWYDAAKEAKLRGARLTFGYVGKDLARMLGKTIEQVVEGQLKAALTDFKAVSATTASVASKLEDGAKVEVDSGGARLSFVLKGEVEVQDGIVGEHDISTGDNMSYVPPGNVVKYIDPASVEGRLNLSPTLTKYGVVAGGEFEFKNGRLAGWKSKDGALLAKLIEPLAKEKRRLTFMGIGANPAMKYGLAQDRFVKGAVTLGGLGFSALVKKGTVSVGGRTLVSAGTLSS